MQKLIVINTLEGTDIIKTVIADNDFLSFDTETTGLSDEAKIIGYSICGITEPETGYYIVLRKWDASTSTLLDLETLNSAEEIISLLSQKQLVMHNAIFDCKVVYRNYKLDLINSLHTDTMILAHILDENRGVGLKDLGLSIFGADATAEQEILKRNVLERGGEWTRANKEMYKAEEHILAEYGAKDAILTMQLFGNLIENLYNQGLEKFFFEESMPLLKGPTYQLNFYGLKVDLESLTRLKSELEIENAELHHSITTSVAEYTKDRYPGTSKKNLFNIGASAQLSWLLYVKLGNVFDRLTDAGKEICDKLNIKIPYDNAAKRNFVKLIESKVGQVYEEEVVHVLTGKKVRAKKVREACYYISADKESLKKLSDKYHWVSKLLKYSKNQKILNTYVIGIRDRISYGIIHPSFLQHGTVSGRYSSRNPNFQNLPADDKRIRAAIVARDGKVFVGADYSQLEPRVFAYFSNDDRLKACFSKGEDFYSIVGAEVFDKRECVPLKEGPNAFGTLYPAYRKIAKTVALSATYGTTAPKMGMVLGKPMQEAQNIIDNYFEAFPSVKEFMLSTHEKVKIEGIVYNLFGRPRHIPDALKLPAIYGKTKHEKLPYDARRLLNESINFIIQSTSGTIINRASIAFVNKIKELGIEECHLLMQVHDELVAECLEKDADTVASILKECMEKTNQLPGVGLEAKPVIAKNLAGLK